MGGEGELKFHLLETLKGGEAGGQKMSYVIPKLLCNSCPCQEGGDNSPRRFRERGRGARLDVSLQTGDIQQDCKSNQRMSKEVWLSLFERSLLLLITPVDVIIRINNVWKSV